MTRDELLALEAADAYYGSGNTIMSDSEFDRLLDKIKKDNPESSVLTRVRAVVRKDRAKVLLARPMSSLNKIKFGKGEVTKFIDKIRKISVSSQYSISDKLDGMAGQLVFDKNGVPVSLSSGGDGTIGEDWSHLIQYLSIKRLNKNADTEEDEKKEIVVRVELLVSFANYEKFKDEFKSPRHMAAGLCNRSDFHLGHRFMSVVAHGIYDQAEDSYPLSKILGSSNLEVVETTSLNSINDESLNALYMVRKSKSKYMLDGLVIKALGCPFEVESIKNPEYVVAFKADLEDNCISTVVDHIEWVPTRHGKLFPRVHVKPVVVGGVTIKHATGHNARYIIDNKLGAGSEVLITLNNEVVAGIHSVVASNREEHEKPSSHVLMDEHDNHYIMSNPGLSREVQQAKTMHFFKTMKVDAVGPKLVEALYDKGIKTYFEILALTPNNLVGINNMQDKMAAKVHRNISVALEKCTLPQLMDASGAFPDGIGERRLEQLFDKAKLEDVRFNVALSNVSFFSSLDGFADHTANLMLEGFKNWDKLLPKFMDVRTSSKQDLPDDFMETSSVVSKLTFYGEVVDRTFSSKNEKTATSNKMEGMVFLWTGFRNENQELLVEQSGGVVALSFSSKVTHLVVKDEYFTSGKVEKAKSSGKCKILTNDEFNTWSKAL